MRINNENVRIAQNQPASNDEANGGGAGGGGHDDAADQEQQDNGKLFLNNFN